MPETNVTCGQCKNSTDIQIDDYDQNIECSVWLIKKNSNDSLVEKSRFFSSSLGGVPLLSSFPRQCKEFASNQVEGD